MVTLTTQKIMNYGGRIKILAHNGILVVHLILCKIFRKSFYRVTVLILKYYANKSTNVNVMI